MVRLLTMVPMMTMNEPIYHTYSRTQIKRTEICLNKN